ncbi:MAG: hypothetical protein HY525_05345 [Betaproteobacteria bacterium]|nr:hypothetical protein [Betaproteobacteria bacterium]
MHNHRQLSVSPAQAPRLLNEVRDVIRRKHYSLRSEQSYVDWINPRKCDGV